MSTDTAFEYRGCRFMCSVVEHGVDTFEPHVLYLEGLSGLEQMPLPRDSDAYAGAGEALRHAQQQAVRWVHDRTGVGQGQF